MSKDNEQLDMTPADVLRAAAERLRAQGWRQGAYGNWRKPDGGPCCLRGAIWAAQFAITGDELKVVNDDAHRAMDAAVYRESAGRHEACAGWNDAKGRTADDVIRLLLATAAELEADHAP